MDPYVVRMQLDCSPRRISKTVLLPAVSFVKTRMIEKLREVKKFGKTHSGRIRKSEVRISVIESGMGAPSAAVIIESLARAEVKRIIRLDFCGGISEKIKIGDIVISPFAIRGDGTTPHYLENERSLEIEGNEKLTDFFIEQFKQSNLPIHIGPVYSHDALFREPESLIEKIKELGGIAIDMETSAIYTVCKKYDIPATAIMVVTDHPAKKKFFYKRDTLRFEMLRNLDKAINIVFRGIIKLENTK